MANRTWLGGGNNNANNPDDWSSTGVPVPGDVLDMQAGTMNVRGNNLAGNSVVIGKEQVGAEPTLNLSHHANVSLEIAQFSDDQVTINVQGSDTLNVRSDFPSSGSLTVNLADHASLAGAFNMTFGSVVINGGNGSRFVNDSSTVLRGLGTIPFTLRSGWRR